MNTNGFSHWWNFKYKIWSWISFNLFEDQLKEWFFYIRDKMDKMNKDEATCPWCNYKASIDNPFCDKHQQELNEIHNKDK